MADQYLQNRYSIKKTLGQGSGNRPTKWQALNTAGIIHRWKNFTEILEKDKHIKYGRKKWVGQQINRPLKEY